MGRRRRGLGWQVEINSSKALEGYRRIVVQMKGTEAEAEALESLIRRNVLTYGKHPVTLDDRPLFPAPLQGTLRIATRLALKTHWNGLPSRGEVEAEIWPIITWLEEHGCPDFEQVTPEIVQALIRWEQVEKRYTNATINQHLSHIETINAVAREHWLGLAEASIPLIVLPLHRETWWLQPEGLADLMGWLERQGEALFADLIRVIVLEGCSIEQALSLRPRHVIGIDSQEPLVKTPDTKTGKAQPAIPIFDAALPAFRRSLERAKLYRWDFLFPISGKKAGAQWNECKRYLGIQGDRTATLRALRGSFPFYAGAASIQPGTLQGMLNRSAIPAHYGSISPDGGSPTLGGPLSGKRQSVPRRRLNRPLGARRISEATRND